jgi:hypothetical protein
MPFQNRPEFVSAATSEKIVLAQLQATSRLYTWALDTGSIYERVTDYFVVALKQGQDSLTQVFSYGALVEGSFYYNVKTSTVYVWNTGDTDPSTEEMIVTYEFYYSNVTINAPYNLITGNEHVLYHGRITASPGYKHKIGIEQALTSLVGTGDLALQNNDGGLDDIFDTLIFENQSCKVYSWNPELIYDDAKLIYKGKVTNKSYNGEIVTFTIKDQIFDLTQTIPQTAFTLDDGVNDSAVGQIKRWVYGKVDGLKVQSIDQIGSGYAITGTITSNIDGMTINGTGTLFLSELSPDDTLIIGEQEITVDTIISDTELTTSDELDFAFSNETAIVVPEISVTSKNRTFFVTDHACSTITKTITEVIQFNRVRLNNTDGLFAGDYVEFSTGERIQIRKIGADNIIVLTQNLITLPAVSSAVVRPPIQSVYVKNRQVLSENYTVSNLGAPTNKLTITLDDDTEFVIARAKDLGIQLTFTNGSRTVTTVEDVDLREILETRDWIRPADIAYTTYYEILSVDEQSLELRVPFADPTHTGDTQAKQPDYIGDDTVVSVNLLGRTVDGEPASDWIFTAADTVKDICSSVGLSDFNTTAFDEAASTSPQIISLALPLEIGTKLITAKDAIDLINKSVYGSLTLDDNLDLQYRILKNDVPSEVRIIRDSDVVSWKIKTTNGKNFRNSIINYRHQDYNRFTEDNYNLIVTHSSNFVRDYIGTNQTSEFDVYLYDTTAATIMAHRYNYFNRLGRTDLTIETDLRLETLEIGDVIQLEFNRLYKRFGDQETRKKLMLVIGLTKTGERLTIEATDLNNTFNSSAVLTENTASDYSAATVNEKLKNGYITTNQGIVNDEETTANINLIS